MACPTWEDYCRQVAGFSKSYASRIINASRVASRLASDSSGELSIGNPVMPVSESQVRPLLKLVEPDHQAQAWVAAVDKAEGKQPTAADVQEAVFEILHPDGPVEKPASRAQQRIDLVGRLKEVIQKKKSWEQVEKLLGELEELL